MKNLVVKWITMLACSTCAGLLAANPPVSPGRAIPALPVRVVERTGKQLEDCLGKTSAKGVPLVDPAIDWNQQSNWPNRFMYEGRAYELDITDLSGAEPRKLKSRAEVRPSKTVIFGYEPVNRGPRPGATNVVSPRGSWSPGERVPGKVLIWGTGEFSGFRREVFSYVFYPSGALHEFYWQPRESENGQWEVFDRNGKLVGTMNSTTCTWQGTTVSRETFTRLSRTLYESGGTPDAAASRPGAAGRGRVDR